MPDPDYIVEEFIWQTFGDNESTQISCPSEDQVQRPKTPDTPVYVKRGVPQTPRKSGISNQAIVYKDPAYNDKLNREMDTRYGQVTFRQFLDIYMTSGRDLHPSELKKLKTLSGLDKVESEKAMYPIIVSVRQTPRHCGSRSCTYIPSATHSMTLQSSQSLRPDSKTSQTGPRTAT
jgi:hypothetical protein